MKKSRLLISCATLLLSGCSVLLPLFGYPPHALRGEPPTAIETSALPVGAKAPAFTLADFSLAKANERGPVVLVFYRGAW